MLIMVLVGAILTYCEIIPMYFTPNYLTCTAAQVLQTEGFLLTYGAIVLKTWRFEFFFFTKNYLFLNINYFFVVWLIVVIRECKLFYVRSVKTIRVTDNTLMKRLSVIMVVGTVFLVIWALRKDGSPRAVELRDVNNLKYLSCTITEWNYISQLSKYSFFFNFKKE